MTRCLVAFALAAVVALAPMALVSADSAQLGANSLAIGEQTTLVIEVLTPPGAAVEVDPAAPSWSGLEVVRIASSTVTQAERESVHRIELVVAPFEPGQREISPAVNVIQGSEVTPRLLPPVQLQVRESLPPGAPLELSPPPPPAPVGGAQSPLLKPAIAVGAVSALLILAALGVLAANTIARRRPPAPEPVALTAPPPSLHGAEQVLDTDPVSAYRTLAATVRGVIASRYGFPAQSLTTAELQRRMEAQGVDRWQARLVGGLLEECDSVVYAGYRPASERRHHDLNMAREIVEAVTAALSDFADQCIDRALEAAMAERTPDEQPLGRLGELLKQTLPPEAQARN